MWWIVALILPQLTIVSVPLFILSPHATSIKCRVLNTLQLTRSQMASSYHLIRLCTLLFPIVISSSLAQTTSFRPKALILPVTKDASSLQYTAFITQGTPPVLVKVTVDVGGEFLWVVCDQANKSSTYKTVPCRSAQCNLGGLKACATEPNICVEFPTNTVINLGSAGDFSQDTLSIRSTDGSNPGRVVSVPKFLFTCAPTLLLEGLASGVKGMAGLGRIAISLPLQFSAAFSFPRKFALCLSSSNGVVFFGDGPYVLLPGIDVSKLLTYTPLIRNPVNLIGGFPGEPSSEYFIGVKSINVGGKPVPVNTTLLSLNKDGDGGTKISTVVPYTLLETSIHKAVVNAFVKALGNVPRVSAVAPFSACFNAKSIPSTRVGLGVPLIEFVLQSEKVVWTINGANSMVFVDNDVACLGFVDGGPLHFVDWGVRFTRTAIVIGGHQLEDNLVQIDLAASRLGFSSSLLARQTTCSNFNFTTTGAAN